MPEVGVKYLQKNKFITVSGISILNHFLFPSPIKSISSPPETKSNDAG